MPNGQNDGYEAVMGKHGVGEMSENGEMFAETCANNSLLIGGSVFPHKTIHKTDHQTMSQNTNLTISISVKSLEGPWEMSEREEGQMQPQTITS